MSEYKQKAELVPFGSRIAEKRAERGMTQEELAAKLGIGRVALTKIETGTQDMKIETLTKLCRILNTSADYFLHGSSAKAMDVFLETGLEDRSLTMLAKYKGIEEDFGIPDSGSRIDVINELFSTEEFYSLISHFSNFRIEWGQILLETAEWEKKKKEAKLYSKDYREATERLQALSERADFIKWRFSQDTAKFTDKLLEVK